MRPPTRRLPTKSAKSSPPRHVATPFESDAAAVPPTPPQKDTPEHIKIWLHRGRPQEEVRADADAGIWRHLPTMHLLDPTMSQGSGESPKKYCPKAAEDQAHVKHAEHVMSAYGVVEHTDTEQSELHTETEEEESSLPEVSSSLGSPSDPENYRDFLESHLSDSGLSDSALSEGYMDFSDPLYTPRGDRRHSDLPPRTPLSAKFTGHAQPDTLKTFKPDTLETLKPDTLKTLKPETLKTLKPDTLETKPETLKYLKPTVYVPQPKKGKGKGVGNDDRSQKVSPPLLLPRNAAQATDLTTHHSPFNLL